MIKFKYDEFRSIAQYFGQQRKDLGEYTFELNAYEVKLIEALNKHCGNVYIGEVDSLGISPRDIDEDGEIVLSDTLVHVNVIGDIDEIEHLLKPFAAVSGVVLDYRTTNQPCVLAITTNYLTLLYILANHHRRVRAKEVASPVEGDKETTLSHNTRAILEAKEHSLKLWELLEESIAELRDMHGFTFSNYSAPLNITPFETNEKVFGLIAKTLATANTVMNVEGWFNVVGHNTQLQILRTETHNYLAKRIVHSGNVYTLEFHEV